MQQAGLNWLVSLYERRLNGILADEMGLGEQRTTPPLILSVLHIRELIPMFVYG